MAKHRRDGAIPGVHGHSATGTHAYGHSSWGDGTVFVSARVGDGCAGIRFDAESVRRLAPVFAEAAAQRRAS